MLFLDHPSTAEAQELQSSNFGFSSMLEDSKVRQAFSILAPQSVPWAKGENRTYITISHKQKHSSIAGDGNVSNDSAEKRFEATFSLYSRHQTAHRMRRVS